MQRPNTKYTIKIVENILFSKLFNFENFQWPAVIEVII